jgi:hypothetical protein
MRHSSWPDEVYVGLSNGQSYWRELAAGLWSDPEKRTLTPEKWATLQNMLAEEPYGLIPRNQTPNEWYSAQAHLGERGFVADFSGGKFLELARQIYRQEPLQQDEAARLASWLVLVARRADEALQKSCGSLTGRFSQRRRLTRVRYEFDFATEKSSPEPHEPIVRGTRAVGRDNTPQNGGLLPPA